MSRGGVGRVTLRGPLKNAVGTLKVICGMDATSHFLEDNFI